MDCLEAAQVSTCSMTSHYTSESNAESDRQRRRLAGTQFYKTLLDYFGLLSDAP
jgi:hypothetical protein